MDERAEVMIGIAIVPRMIAIVGLTEGKAK